MNILSKSFITGALAIAMAAAAFTASMATTAEARGWHHFRHAFNHCYNHSSHPGRCFGRLYAHSYAFGYGFGYRDAGNCGWQVVTVKKWNLAHTRLVIINDKVWTCY